MENTSIPRPMTSARRVAAPTPARAHITRPVATPRPQTQERKNTGGPSLVRPGVGAATSSTRLTKAHNHPGVTAPTQLPPSGPANRSRQTPVQQSGEKPTPPSRNFSRPGAAPLATRRQPAIAAQRVHQVGFENWALRHESVAALPQPARGSDYARAGIVRSFKGRVPSVEEQWPSQRLSGGESLTTVSEDQTAVVRWQDASKRPERIRGAAIRSQAASLVAPTATESVTPSVAVMKVRPLHPGQRLAQYQLLPASPVRPSLPAAVESTYLEMQPRYSRAPTRLPPTKRGPDMGESWGENFSRFSSGTTARDIERRRGLTTKFPLPGNAVANAGRERERHFTGEAFVDAPVVVGEGRRTGTLIERINELKEQGLRERIDGVRGQSAAACAPGIGEGDVVTAESGKGKGKWRRIPGFFARKLGWKGTEASSPSVQTASPQAAGSTPLLVRGSSSDEALSPVTPRPVEAEQPVAVVESPVDLGEIFEPASRASSPILRPYVQAPLRGASTIASHETAESESVLVEIEDPAATARALRREYDELMSASPREEAAVEDAETASSSPLQGMDLDLFPSPLASSDRWAPAELGRDSAFYDAVAEAIAEEEAEVDWSVGVEDVHEAVAKAVVEEEAAERWSEGSVTGVQRVESVGKGKARVVDVPRVRSRYASVRRGVVGMAPEGGGGPRW